MASYTGLLGALTDPKNSSGLLDFGSSLLAGSGYAPQPRTFGQLLGAGMLNARSLADERAQAEMRRRYMDAQIKALEAPSPMGQASITGPLQEYEAAKAGGFQGSYLDFVRAKTEASRVAEREQVGDPATVREWEYFNRLTPAQQRQFLEMKRSFPVVNVEGAPTQVMPGGATNPLSTPAAEQAAAARRAELEAAARAAGEATGEREKKAVSGQRTMALLENAEALVDKSTGSVLGAIYDKGAGAVGQSTPGAQAIAELKVLQAGLMLNMPRMEGPQSDKDTQLYREAAGQIGDPSVPRETRKAAIRTIRTINARYMKAARPIVYPRGSPEDVSASTPAGAAPQNDPLGIR